MKTELTTMTDKVLCNLYRIYLERLAASNNRELSKEFVLNRIDTNLFQDKFFIDFSYDTLSDYISELEHLGYVDKQNIGGTFYLTNKSIFEMENRFKNNIREISKFIFNAEQFFK